jgi:hypothetical protein
MWIRVVSGSTISTRSMVLAAGPVRGESFSASVNFLPAAASSG